MKAMILAAGKGTRLGKLTDSIPKVLMDINGRSVLQIAVEKCTSYGFRDIIINVHHLADQVEQEASRLNKLGFRITVSDEREKLLETGGGLFRARDFFNDSPFLLYNADIITDLDLLAFYRFHSLNKALATLAVRKRKGNRYFLIDSEGTVKGWTNKANGETILTETTEDEVSEIAFSGMHIIEPEIFKYMDEGIYTMTSLYLRLAGSQKINSYRNDEGYWFDIGTPESLSFVREFLGRRR